jgi:diguanylate cyclase (GGDEF)-like protein
MFSGPLLVRGNLIPLAGLTCFAVTLARALVREFSGDTDGPRTASAATMREVELGLLLLTGAFLLVALTGGNRSFLYPLVYGLVSFLVLVSERSISTIIWVAAACVLEVLVEFASPRVSWSLGLYHAVAILFFGAGNRLVLGGLARRLRGEHVRRLELDLAQMRQEARDFRLIASQLPPESRAARTREQEELRMARAAVDGIHDQLFFTIELLRSSLNLHTCALLWLQDRSAGASRGRELPRLFIKEIATSSDLVRANPLLDGPGVLSAVVRDPKALRLKNLNGRRVPPYYEGPEAITDLCAVPLLEGAVVRGFICADRVDGRPFSDEEQAALATAAEHVLRVIEQERAFSAVERSKYEQERFYRASELLNEALTLEAVYDRTFDAVASIRDCSLMALTMFDESREGHRILASRLDPALKSDRAWSSVEQRLEGLTFSNGKGLVSSAVKNRHYMPVSGEILDGHTVIFDADTRLRRAKSVLVLPLVHGETAMGALVLASERGQHFPSEVREMLRVICHQVSTSLQNARMYRLMEERATTDGLTGLTNHRAFQERYENLHALCERTDQRFSVILTDIDHFKSVNDTYGHPVGDAVLKRVAAILEAQARKVDIVARYGGEEFVLVLPDTDGPGAELFANRLREEVGAQVMHSENGDFNVTLSMGVATFPDDGRARQELVDKADQALYYCKEHGRNCVTRWVKG